MKNEKEQNNVAQVMGRIVGTPTYSHEIEGEKFYEFSLENKRLSDQYDYIPVTVSERIVAGRKIGEGDVVGVIGEFRSYNKIQDEKSKLILHVFTKSLFTEDELINSGMEQNVNNVVITGYICKKPIYRVTPLKREICDVLIAVNRKNLKSDYLPCIAWGRNARYMDGLEVGTKLTLEGRIQSRNYVKKLPNGLEEDRVAYELSVASLRECEEIGEQVYSKNEAYKDFLSSSHEDLSLIIGNEK